MAYITTTLDNLKNHKYWSFHQKEWTCLLEGLGKVAPDGEPLKFSTILELTDSRFTFWCVLVSAISEDNLCLLTSEIVARKVWRQRDRMLPNNNSLAKDISKAWNMIYRIRKWNMIYRIRKGRYFSNIRIALSDQAILNARDASRSVSDKYESLVAISARDAEYDWYAQKIVEMFG